MASSRPFDLSTLGLGLVLACAVHANAHALAHTHALVQETVGAWQVYCRTLPQSKGRRCALVQRVTAEDQQNLALTLMLYREIEGTETLLRAVVPLGVLLPRGLGLRIDGEDAGTAPFVRCTRRGCVAEAVLKKEEIAHLKRG